MNRLRVVFDTSVYVSAVVFGGIPAKILVAALAGVFTLCTSEIIGAELTVTVTEKFGWPEDRVNDEWAYILHVAEYIEPTSTLAIITPDLDDNRILECAVDGRADIIVTGDDHLLTLANKPQPAPIDRVRILRPRQFLDLLNQVKS